MADIPHPVSATRRPLANLFVPMTLLYASYGLVLGFVQGGIGPILVARGVPVAQVGLTAILFLPLGLAFLWSPLIERWRIPLLPAPIGWVILMQSLAMALLCLIAFAETAPLSVLLCLGLCVTVAMATMDVQLEGVVVELVDETQRPTAAAIKIGTFTLGAVVGGGMLVGLFERVGWTASFLSMAVFLLAGILSLTLLNTTDMARRETPRVDLRSIFGRKLFLRRLLTVALLLASCFLLFGLNRVALVDLGVPLEQVGWLVGIAGPIIGLPVIALAGAGASRFGSVGVFAGFAVLGVACGLLRSASAAFGWQMAAIGATLAGGCALAGAYVVLLGKLLAWSVGDRPATDYATFYGLGNLAAMLPMAGAGVLAAHVGWPAYYLIATTAFIAATWWMTRTIEAEQG